MVLSRTRDLTTKLDDFRKIMLHIQIMAARCRGFCRCQVISNDIGHMGQGRHCISSGRITTACVISMWKNCINCMYIFIFLRHNSVPKGQYCINATVNWMIIGSDKGVLPMRDQAITWTTDDFDFTLRSQFIEKEIHLNISYAKWRPLYGGPRMLTCPYLCVRFAKVANKHEDNKRHQVDDERDYFTMAHIHLQDKLEGPDNHEENGACSQNGGQKENCLEANRHWFSRRAMLWGFLNRPRIYIYTYIYIYIYIYISSWLSNHLWT